MEKYQKGKIYKIVCDDNDLVYVGSTCKSLQQRFVKHKNHFNDWNNNKDHASYLSSFQILPHNGVKIELLENYPCDSLYELKEREKYYITTIENCVNQVIPIRTVEEKKQLKKKYAKDNAVKLAEYHNEYRNNNKETLKDHYREYRAENREQIRERRKIKYACECGAYTCFDHKSRHEKSKRHQNFLVQVNN